jgi:GTPase SAR1 family protein
LVGSRADVLFGVQGCGKTQLVRRFAEGEFSEKHVPSIGVDFLIKNYEVDGRPIVAQIWDTAGLESNRTKGKSFYLDTQAILLVFDLTNRQVRAIATQCCHSSQLRRRLTGFFSGADVRESGRALQSSDAAGRSACGRASRSDWQQARRGRSHQGRTGRGSAVDAEQAARPA